MSASPPRNSSRADLLDSPPRHRAPMSPLDEISRPRRHISIDRSASPPRNRHNSIDRSASPPRNRHISIDRSASPPRHRHNSIDRSASPPRHRHNSIDRSASPPRHRHNSIDRSPSPPRRAPLQHERDISLPRHRAPADHSTSPPRQPPSNISISPSRRYDTSPPRRKNYDDVSSPPRRNARPRVAPTDHSVSPPRRRAHPPGVHGDDKPTQLPSASSRTQTTVLRDSTGKILSEEQLRKLDTYTAHCAIQSAQDSVKREAQKAQHAMPTLASLNDPDFKHRGAMGRDGVQSATQTVHGTGLAQHKNMIKQQVLAALGKTRFKDPSSRTNAELSQVQQGQIKVLDPLLIALHDEKEHKKMQKEEAKKREKLLRLQRIEERYQQAILDGDIETIRRIDEYREAQKRKEEEDCNNFIRIEAAQVDFRVVRHPETGDLIRRVKKPTYTGGELAPNRFNIVPGHRWDGIERGNGWERERRTIIQRAREGTNGY